MNGKDDFGGHTSWHGLLAQFKLGERRTFQVSLSY